MAKSSSFPVLCALLLASLSIVCATPFSDRIVSKTLGRVKRVPPTKPPRASDTLLHPDHSTDVQKSCFRNGYNGQTEDEIRRALRLPGVGSIPHLPRPFDFVATSSARSANGAEVFLTHVVRATITSEIGRADDSLPDSAKQNVNNMYGGKRPEKVDTGHIIACTLGGDPESFNFVGQTVAVNRGAYKYMEDTIRKHLRANYGRGHYAKLAIALSYDGTVPVHMYLKLQIFEGNHHLLYDFGDLIFDNHYTN